MGWTTRQQDAIESRHESLLVSAAAGSGKTSVLVERVTQLLLEGADLDNMLVVTFTNAAALEMKQRVCQRVGASAVRHSHISTFHKFAIEVLSAYYHTIGIDPGLKVCDEYQQNILKNKALDSLIEEKFESGDEDFKNFLDCYCTSKSNDGVRSLILQFCTFLESLPYPEEFLEKIESGEAFDTKAYMKFASEVVSNLIESSLMHFDEADELLFELPKLRAKNTADIDKVKAIRDAFSESGLEKAIGLACVFKAERMVATNAEKEDYALIKDRVAKERDFAKDALKSISENFGGLNENTFETEKELTLSPLRQLCSLAREFMQKYSALKLKAKLMDFSDIEHYALSILKNEDVCKEYREKFDYIFVDEYQDSNLVQDELIRKISRPDNLFLVGDVKQSIYKFRLAEPEIFLDKYKKFKSGSIEKSRAIDLNANFRSKPPVIDFVNDVFRRLMTEQSVGLTYDKDAELVADTSYTCKELFTPEFDLIVRDSEEDGDDAVEDLKNAELEALNAVALIKKYHGTIIYDSKAKCTRPLEYGDMVILMRAVKGMGEIFYQYLEAADIPVFLARGEGYFDTPEIQTFLNLLRIIDNSRQDVPLLSVLHFPSFGFSAAELSLIRIFANRNGLFKSSYSDAFKLYAEKGDNLALKERCENFIKLIKKWKREADLSPLSDYIWNLMSQSGILAYAGALPMGTQRTANLRALVDKADNFQQQGGGGLYDFVSYIESISDKGISVETGQVSTIGEGADAVRIMTIHKSKGLEFPFVLLAGLGKHFNTDRNIYHAAFHKDFGASIRIVNPKKNAYVDPLSMKLISVKKSQEELAETIRVLYVAMTRAKDILCMSAVVKSEDNIPQNSFANMIYPSLGMADVNIIPAAKFAAMGDSSNTHAEDILKGLEKGFDEETASLSKEEIKNRLFFDYSPKPEDLLKRKYSVSEIAALKRGAYTGKTYASYRKSYPKPSFMSETMPLDAASKGTAYHKVMEHIPFTAENKTADCIKQFIEELENKNILTSSEASCIDPMRIAAFFESDIGKRAISSKEIHKEAPFVLKTVFDGRNITVQGTIDCYFKEGDKYVLLDYKSNYIDESSIDSEKQRMKDEYIPQLELYREALVKLTSTDVKEGVLYLFGLNDTVTIC